MLPRVIIHMGVSVDGRYDWGLELDTPYYEIVQRLKPDVDLSGSNTILKANLPGDPEKVFGDVYKQYVNSPDRGMLVVVDSRGQIRTWDLIQKQPWWRKGIALCSNRTPHSHLDYLGREGIEFIVAGEDHVDLRRALEELNTSFDVNVVRVDSGGILNGILLRAGLVDEVNIVISPELVGGTSPRTMYVAPDLTSSEGVIPLRLCHVQQMKNDFVWLRYDVIKEP
jgi:2,5-diamino-6-(ribosylamino)-4(3H)-pyrimidinone 5'-phosphate reductase